MFFLGALSPREIPAHSSCDEHKYRWEHKDHVRHDCHQGWSHKFVFLKKPLSYNEGKAKSESLQERVLHVHCYKNAINSFQPHYHLDFTIFELKSDMAPGGHNSSLK